MKSTIFSFQANNALKEEEVEKACHKFQNTKRIATTIFFYKYRSLSTKRAFMKSFK